MAKARGRGRAKMGRRKPVRKDWVYTDEGYFGFTFSQISGVAGQFAIPLVFSSNARRIIPYGPQGAVPIAAIYRGGYQDPDPTHNVIYAVDGHVVYYPSAWALGSEFHWAWRLVIADMAPDTGEALVDPDYSLWVSGGGVAFQAWRNDSDVLAEGRWYRSFGDATSVGSWVAPVRWSRANGRRLEEDEGLFLFLEGAAASVNTARNRNFLRTLVKAPS